MPTAPKWLKIRTLNLARMIPGKVASPDMSPEKIREKGVGSGSRDPQFFGR